MYVCMYIYIYIHTYIHITYIYIYIHISIYTLSRDNREALGPDAIPPDQCWTRDDLIEAPILCVLVCVLLLLLYLVVLSLRITLI